MLVTTRKASGFTLVEILIVVVILGILAAIVIPQFTNASQQAMKSSTQSTLQTVRSQLQLYQVQHNGLYPDIVGGGWTNMLSSTNSAGSTGVSGTSFPYGPYLQQPPINPFDSLSTVALAGPSTVGWLYNSTTGAILASCPSAQASTLGLTTNDVATY